MSFSSDMAEGVDEILAEVGVPIQVITQANASQDPALGTVTNSPEATYTIVASPLYEFNQLFGDGSLVRAGDMKTVISGEQPFAVDLAVAAVVDGVRWLVARVITHRAGSTPTAYELHLRR